MYLCNNCLATFTTPRIQYDDVGDEQYDVCPKCASEDFDTCGEHEWLPVTSVADLKQGIKIFTENKYNLPTQKSIK